MNTDVKTRKFTVDEYETMVEAGVLTERENVELIRGEIIEMTPIGRRHAACVKRFIHEFSQFEGKGFILDVQNPIRIEPDSEPEPDVVLLEPRDDFYESAHPGPDEIHLIVEVAGTSEEFDRTQKIPLYAESGVPEVWLVDLQENLVQRYREPVTGEYTDRHERTAGDKLIPSAFPNVEIQVENILPNELSTGGN